MNKQLSSAPLRSGNDKPRGEVVNVGGVYANVQGTFTWLELAANSCISYARSPSCSCKFEPTRDEASE